MFLIVLMLTSAVSGALSSCTDKMIFESYYGSQAIKNLTRFRQQLVVDAIENSAHNLSGHSRYEVLFPIVTSCPPRHPLVKIGGTIDEDGQKYICDGLLKPPCVVYSMGSNGDYSFEHEILNTTMCLVFTFDCTYDGTSIHSRHRYEKLCLGKKVHRDFRTWREVTATLGHTRVDLLKVDIEGYEFDLFASFEMDIYTLPLQISVELHLFRDSGRNYVHHNVQQMSALFMHLAYLSYAPFFSYHNLYGKFIPDSHFGCCSEYSFLRLKT